jgi:predicted anti-sigma-YlaC factor YlaD
MTRNGGACARVKMLLGVYVLGGLRGTKEARVRAHLKRCIPCRAEYDELAEIIPFLDMITGAEAAEDAPGSAGSRDDAGHGPRHGDG